MSLCVHRVARAPEPEKKSLNVRWLITLPRVMSTTTRAGQGLPRKAVRCVSWRTGTWLPTRPAMALRAHLLLACASTVAGRIFLYESSLTQSLPLPAPTSAPIGRRLNRCTSCGPDTADDGTGTCEITCDSSRRLSERSTVMHGRLSSYLATRPRSAELNSHLDALWELWGVRRGLQSGLSTCQETRVAARCTPSPPPPSSPPPFVCLSCGNSTTETAQQCEVPCAPGRRLTEEAQEPWK